MSLGRPSVIKQHTKPFGNMINHYIVIQSYVEYMASYIYIFACMILHKIKEFSNQFLAHRNVVFTSLGNVSYHMVVQYIRCTSQHYVW